MTVTTIRTATGFAQLGDDGTATLLDLARQPTGQTRPLTESEQALVAALAAHAANDAQEAHLRALLAGARDKRDGITALRAQLATRAQTYATARTTLTSALAGIPASPNATQLRAGLMAIGTYLAVDNDTGVAVGTALDDTLDGLDDVIAGLANYLARDFGELEVADGVQARTKET